MPASDQNTTTAPEVGPTTLAPSPTPSGASPHDVRTPDKQYEFKEDENRIIGQLASKMNFVGLFLFANGILTVAIGVHPLFHVGPIITGALMCVVGLWTQRASSSFRNVVDTEGHDISHLMKALDDLRKLYSLQFWLVILGVLLALVGLWAIHQGYVNLIG
jgi:hypothetical protein